MSVLEWNEVKPIIESTSLGNKVSNEVITTRYAPEEIEQRVGVNGMTNVSEAS